MISPPLYDHQKKAVEELNSGKILVGGVGSGKSRTALAYFCIKECDRMKRPKPLYIITTARKRDTLDWVGEAAYFGIGPNPDESKTPFIVDSWNNLHKYVDVENSFFIFDEQRVVGYGAWTKAFLQVCKKNRWILLSATPGDTWMDYIPVFLANGFYKNKTEFITRHVIYSRYTKYPKVERYIDVERLVYFKKKILVMMPFSRRTTSHPILVECDYDSHEFMRVYRGRWNVFKNQPIAQAGEWCYCMRQIVNSNPDRIDKLISIFEEKKRVIVFYNFDYELEMIRDGLSKYSLPNSSGFTLAEYNGHSHQPIPENEQWIYLVQYNAGAEAWNCITTDTIVFYSLNYSYKMMEQASGRINRMNTPYKDLYYYILYSKSTIDKSILLALKNKRDFNANRFYNKHNEV